MEINKYEKYEKNISKNKSFIKSFKLIIKILKGNYMLLVISLMLLVASCVCQVFSPIIIKEITTNITNSRIVLNKCITLITINVASNFSIFISSICFANISNNVTKKIRNEIFNKIISVKFFKLLNINDDSVISLITYDIDTINFTLSGNIITLTSNFISIIGVSISAVIISPILSIFLFIPLILSFIRTSYISKNLRKSHYEKSKGFSKYYECLTESVEAHDVILSYGIKEKCNDYLLKYNNDFYDKSLTAEKYGSSVSPFSHTIQHICIVLISVFSLIFVYFDLTTIAIYSAFILYSKKFADPISDISTAYSEFSNSYASLTRIKEFLNEKVDMEDNSGMDIETVDEIKSENLTFSYTGDKLVLDDINIDIFKNQSVAIVGHTGCGKTTLITILLGLLEKNGGSLEVNSIGYEDINMKSFRNNISYISQNAWIFTGTVLENITYGLDTYDMNLVMNVCKEIGIHEEIMKKPNGYNEMISKDTIKFSNGQLQLISIARVIIQNKRIIIMDEPTSNLDLYSEIKIKNILNKYRKNRTSIVIAHRLSTITSSDQIIVMDKARIVESGIHDDLINNHGLYYTLYTKFYETMEE